MSSCCEAFCMRKNIPKRAFDEFWAFLNIFEWKCFTSLNDDATAWHLEFLKASERIRRRYCHDCIHLFTNTPLLLWYDKDENPRLPLRLGCYDRFRTFLKFWTVVYWPSKTVSAIHVWQSVSCGRLWHSHALSYHWCLSPWLLGRNINLFVNYILLQHRAPLVLLGDRGRPF